MQNAKGASAVNDKPQAMEKGLTPLFQEIANLRLKFIYGCFYPRARRPRACPWMNGGLRRGISLHGPAFGLTVSGDTAGLPVELHFHRTRYIAERAGFTLMETIVALAIIIAAVVGPVSLVTSGLLNFSSAKNKLIAANLAQEGIELIRAVRDNNIICNQQNGPQSWDWNRDPDGGNLTNTTREPDISQTTVITCGPSSITTPRLPIFIGQSLRRDSATGIYGYVGDIVTPFTRKVDIRVPAQNPDGGIPASDQMDIVSTVEWKQGATTKNVVLRERLYNWK